MSQHSLNESTFSGEAVRWTIELASHDGAEYAPDFLIVCPLGVGHHTPSGVLANESVDQVSNGNTRGRKMNGAMFRAATQRSANEKHSRDAYDRDTKEPEEQ